MLTGLAYIFLLGLFMGFIFKNLHMPPLMGMIVTGIILGPHVLDALDGSLLGISAELRELALVIILIRAGLTLNVADLKKVGRPAILMCFVPAAFELLAITLIAPAVMGISYIEAAIMGSVVAAVSPAVIVPRMIKLIEEGYGKERSIPQLILAGATADDVFVIVMFTAFTQMEAGEKISVMEFINIPLSIILGIILGMLVGYLLVVFFKKFHMRDSIKILIIFGLAFLMLELEDRLADTVAVSGLIAIMTMGIVIKQSYEVLAIRLAGKYSKMWVGAEILLFVLVGVIVDLSYVWKAGVAAIIIIVVSLAVRMLGVLVCLIKTKLTKKERIFCMMAYTPKATVQAAIGGIPLAMGLACGNQVLTVAVLSILITAPLGAWFIDCFGKKLLDK